MTTSQPPKSSKSELLRDCDVYFYDFSCCDTAVGILRDWDGLTNGFESLCPYYVYTKYYKFYNIDLKRTSKDSVCRR